MQKYKISNLFFIIFFFCTLFFSQNILAKKVNYRTLFISSSSGNDRNPGTQALPLKTLGKIGKEKKKLCIKLKCNDVFYENLFGFTNCIIESYGKGRKPILCGFRVLNNTGAWQEVGKGTWRLNMLNENFVGFQPMTRSGKVNIGCLYDAENDSIIGKLVSNYNKMEKAGDFFTTNRYSGADSTLKYLYIKCDSNPSSLGHLCFSSGVSGITNMDGCIIRNVSVVGFGCHGMAKLNNTIVKNCDIDIIGGSILWGYKYWVRFGNGIEFYLNANNPIGNSTVEKCTISRTYDSGSTIQGGLSTVCPQGIKFKNNAYWYCGQGWEFWQGSANECNEYIDCEFTGNILYGTGQNAFSGFRMQNANYLCYDSKQRYLKMEGNLCYGGDYYFGVVLNSGLRNNRVYVFKGSNIFSSWKNSPKIKAVAMKEYTKISNDNSKFYVLEEGSEQDKKIKKRIIRKIDYHQPILNIYSLIKH